MFSGIFLGMQQDLKLALVAPLVCAIFRFIFIRLYAPDKSFMGQERKWLDCFRFGFWWGMDFNAYVFLILFAVVTVPGVFVSAYFLVGNYFRIGLLAVYMFVLYAAFMGKLIFYFHFHDIYNPTVRLGGNADKRNFLDIFFNQNHGMLILAGILPYMALYSTIAYGLVSIPLIPYPVFASFFVNCTINLLLFLGAVALFYFFRYGGTFDHRKKPEWDTVPETVKKDMFFAKAVVDDLVALELVFKRPVQSILKHDDETSKLIMTPLIQTINGDDILVRFKRTAEGPRITKPSHIFCIVGESYTQAPFDAAYEKLHIADAGKAFRSEAHTVTVDNFLPAGLISQPAVTSLISGIFDCNLEINEKQAFWKDSLPTSLPRQLSSLGYTTALWYGGSLSWSSLGLFARGMGFDETYSGLDICGEDAPQTWLGIYDHIFLDALAKKLSEYDDKPYFHFIYTTSNHGPYTIPIEKYGFSPRTVLSELPESMRKNKSLVADLGTYWYSDRSLGRFVNNVRQLYPDCLIIVTGDHSRNIIPFGSELYPKKEATVREKYCTSFSLYHREFTKELFRTARIGGHMNILPTLIEAIAPQGFEYYSLMPSFFELFDHAITPYHWLTKKRIGFFDDKIAQTLEADSDIEQNISEFGELREAYCEVTGWVIRHKNNG